MLSSQIFSIYTVSRLNRTVRMLLEQKIGQVWISGEISNFTQPVSGHWYFTLKDNNAQVRCAIFRNINRKLTFRPQYGQQVLVRANITLYEPRGDYQIIVESIQQAGEGLLQQKYEQLKTKLSIEGLFDQKYKKSLPCPAHCIGIITSKTSAALQDILHILKRRDPSLPIIIYPTIVQGDNAPEKIVRAIELANIRKECDVLIVGRGGGSLEDLWSFNDERIARAIFTSQIPIVSAVGHEKDVTIADFVADLRAPTPSAAAELVSRNHLELLCQIQNEQRSLEMAMDYFLTNQHQQFNQLYHRLQNQRPQLRLARQQAVLARLHQRMNFLINNKLKNCLLFQQRIKQRLNQCNQQQQIYSIKVHIQKLRYNLVNVIHIRFSSKREYFSNLFARLETVSPVSTLARGYSVAITIDGKVLKQVQQIKVGDILMTRLVNGWVKSKVQSIKLEKDMINL